MSRAPNSSENTSSKSKARAITGKVIGGVSGITILVGGGVFVIMRRRRQASRADSADIIASPGTNQGYNMGRGITIEPFPYTDSRNLNHDVHQPASKACRLQPSRTEDPMESREISQGHVNDISKSSSARASSHAGGGKSVTSIVPLLAGTKTGSSRAGNQQTRRTEGALSSPLLETMRNRDRSLRDEVEDLRREVERIRDDGIETASEAPPTYRDDWERQSVL